MLPVLILETRIIGVLCPYPRALDWSWCSGGGGPRGGARRGPGCKPNTSWAAEKRSKFSTPRRWEGMSPQSFSPCFLNLGCVASRGPWQLIGSCWRRGTTQGQETPWHFFQICRVFFSRLLFLVSFLPFCSRLSWDLLLEAERHLWCGNWANVCFPYNG